MTTTDPRNDSSDSASTNGGYSPTEIRRNRRNIVLTSLAFIALIWFRASFQGAIVLTLIVAAIAALVWKLFATSTAAKLDSKSPGMGKHVRPLTMGAILGFIYKGFRD